MARTTYQTRWGSDTITIAADWAQASCPVEGVPGGRQVADFAHRPREAMDAALSACAEAEGLDLDADETIDWIQDAIDAMTAHSEDDPAGQELPDDDPDGLDGDDDWDEDEEEDLADEDAEDDEDYTAEPDLESHLGRTGEVMPRPVRQGWSGLPTTRDYDTHSSFGNNPLY